MSQTVAPTGTHPTEDAVLELQRESESQHLARLGFTGFNAAGFLVAALLVLLLPSDRHLSPVALASALAAYAIASRIEVEFPGFVAVPTEAIFVVMWFVLPLSILPLAVCAGMLLGGLPDVLRRRMPPDRLALTVASCWYSIGPALVLYFAGVGRPRWQDIPIYLAAILAQFVFDFVSMYAQTRAVASVALRAPTSRAPASPTGSTSCSRRSACSPHSPRTAIRRRCSSSRRCS